MGDQVIKIVQATCRAGAKEWWEAGHQHGVSGGLSADNPYIKEDADAALNKELAAFEELTFPVLDLIK